MMNVDHLLKLSPGLEYLCGKRGCDNEVKYVDIIEIPEGMHWAVKGDFIITTGFFLKDRPELLERLLASLIAAKCAGLGIKLGKYVSELGPAITQMADEHRFPILNIHPDISYRDIQYAAFTMLSEEDSRGAGNVIADRKSLYAALISPNPPTGLYIQNLAKRFGVGADAPRFVMVAPADSIMTEITYDFPSLSLVHYTQDGVCACIWDCQSDDFLYEMRIASSAFSSVCRFKTPAIGVSDVCLKAEHMRQAYMNAKFAMDTGHITEPKVKIHYYMDYYLHRLIRDSLPNTAVLDAAQTFTKPLLQYDSETGLGLFDTLWALCRANFNMQRACQELNIHRNTLYVRLEKIRSLTDLDIDSYKSRQSAHMAVLYELIEGRYK